MVNDHIDVPYAVSLSHIPSSSPSSSAASQADRCRRRRLRLLPLMVRRLRSRWCRAWRSGSTKHGRHGRRPVLIHMLLGVHLPTCTHGWTPVPWISCTVSISSSEVLRWHSSSGVQVHYEQSVRDRAPTRSLINASWRHGARPEQGAHRGLTLFHCSAQRKHLLSDTMGNLSVSMTKTGSGCSGD
jgi:hypothetical protein